MRIPPLACILVLVPVLSAMNTMAQPGGCSPPASNGTCPTAIALTVDGECMNGTTCAGGAQAASSCLYAGSQCAWYSFTATATNMYVNIGVTATSGCHISSNVYRATGPCVLTQISCLSGAPLDDMHSLTGLTIGTLYYVQVCYSPGGPCGNGGSAQYCIEVGIPDPPCNVCSAPCGTAAGYPTTPTVAQVVEDCETSPLVPALQPGSTHTFCYNFTATSTSVNFNVIITSNCTNGNVTNFSWSLYHYPACGPAFQTGSISSLTFNGLVIGNGYVFCYTFTVPANCTHSQHCPYFVGASTPLPITWIGIDASITPNDDVLVEWSTGSELNNDYFTVERSADGSAFEAIGQVDGAGDSYSLLRYAFVDEDPYSGFSYYRVKQTDHDGTFDHSNTVSVWLVFADDRPLIMPNPVQDIAFLDLNADAEGGLLAEIIDPLGRIVFAHRFAINAGRNTIELRTEELPTGVYMLTLTQEKDRRTVQFLKE